MRISHLKTTDILMRVLGIITARGGSKGIPNKNLIAVGGKPLLEYTARAALSARRLARTVISTDCNKIADAAVSMGIDCPFMRPAHLAQDDTPTIPVLQNVIEQLRAEGEEYDAVFTLQPTNPLRTPDDIDGSIELLQKTGADSVIGFSDVGERHPARMKTIASDGRVEDPDFAEQFEGQRRQELPQLFLRDGAVYVTRTSVLMEQASIKGDDCRGWLIPPQRALNIDEPFDLFLAEQLIRLGPDQFAGRPAGMPRDA